MWDIPLIDSVPSGSYWDERNLCWTNIYSKMLVADGHKFILVPKRLVSYSKEYTSEKYTQHFVLNFLQNEQLRMNTSLIKERVKSKEKYVTKKDIKENELVNHTFDKEWLAKFTLQHPEVFFYRLATTYGITCRFIMIECKNYSRDIKNSELDQLAGRFSPNRGKFGIAACRNDISKK